MSEGVRRGIGTDNTSGICAIPDVTAVPGDAGTRVQPNAQPHPRPPRPSPGMGPCSCLVLSASWLLEGRASVHAGPV